MTHRISLSQRLNTRRPIDWAHPLNTGLVSRWAISEPLPGWTGSAALRDMVRGAKPHNDGTLNGGVTWDTGQYGKCLSFNGSNGYVDVPSFTLGGSGDVTTALWAKATNWSGLNCMLVEHEPVNGDWELFIETANLKVRGGSNTSVDYSLLGGNSIADGWHHFAATISGTTAKLYIDGAQVSSGTVVATAGGSGTLNIGRYSGFGGGYYFGGGMDYAAVWCRALSAAEVALLYQYTRSRYDPTLNWLPRKAFSVPVGGGSTTFTATATVAVGRATSASVVAFIKPTYTAATALAAAHATSASSSTFAPGTKTASAAPAAGHTTSASVATFLVHTYTASAVPAVGHATSASVATFTVPTYTAAVSALAGHATSASTAVFASAVFIGVGASSVGHATSASSATFVQPTYTTAGVATTGTVVCSASVHYAKTYTASASPSAGPAVSSSVATFSLLTFHGAAAVTAGHAASSSTASFARPTYSATVTLTAAHAMASAVSAPPSILSRVVDVYGFDSTTVDVYGFDTTMVDVLGDGA